MSAVIREIRENNIDGVRHFLKKNPANVNARDERSGNTPLHVAVVGGNVPIVRELLLPEWDADVNAKDGFERTPLHKLLPVASTADHEAIARLLLERGADINAKDMYGNTPLHIASQSGHEPMVRLFLERGADVNAKDRGGWTPLLFASAYGRESIVRLLLEKGVDVNAKDRGSGWTPLHAAVKNNRVSTVRVLLEGGADLDARTAIGMSALDMAKTKEMKDLLGAYITKKRGAKALVEFGDQTQFPPEINAEILKFLTPERTTARTPAQQARKIEKYRAMAQAGPAVDAAHKSRRARENALLEADALAAMKTGGRRKTRRQRRTRAQRKMKVFV